MSNKFMRLLYLAITNISMITHCMETDLVWDKLPIELKSYILSTAGNDYTMSSIIKKLKSLGLVNKEFKELIKSILFNPESVDNLAKKYIEECPESAYKEFAIAIRYNYTIIVKALINGGIDVNFKNDTNDPALTNASSFANPQIVQMLIDAGADINHKNSQGSTALTQAAQRKEKEIAEILIKANANVNTTTYYGTTPLMVAAYSGNHEIVKLLIDAGADVNTKGCMNNTALILAASIDNIELIQILVSAGAEVNAQNREGNTALMLAARKGLVDIVVFLLNNGADADIENSNNQTALISARLNTIHLQKPNKLQEVLEILQSWKQ